MNTACKTAASPHKNPVFRTAVLIAATLLLAGGNLPARAATGHANNPVPALAPSTRDALLRQAHSRDGSTQAILVTAESADAPRARLATYAYQSGHWHKVMGPIRAVLGRNGISLHKREGDGKSPAGIFRMGRAFGSHPMPSGLKLPYTQTTRYDYWVDHPASTDYNQWETYYGNPHQRWKSFERLDIPAYAYAAVIQYNMHPVRKGAGSAIFFHIWPGPNGHTVGCTAVSEPHVLRVLRWLDPARQPVIIQGTREQLRQLAAGRK